MLRHLSGWCIAFAIGLWPACSVAWQVPANGTSGGDSRPATASADTPSSGERGSEPRAGDTVIVLDKDGNPVEVPVGPTWEGYLKFVREHGLPSDNDLPDFYIARIQLNGSVNVEDAVASLDISVLVRVIAADRAVDVPLRLGEATLRDHSYSGSGRLAFVPTERGNGIAVRLSGAGEHTLQLKTLVSVRKTGDTSRLQLSLPPCPQTELSLNVPGDRIVVRGESTSGRTQVDKPANGTTSIRSYGFGSSLDLSWQQVSAEVAVRPQISATSFISAMFDRDGAELDVEQTVVATRGSISRLTIEIPSGFLLRSVTSPTHPDIEFEQPEFPRVPIQFAEPTTGPVKLVWSLHAANETQTADKGAVAQEPGFSVPFELQGFRVAEASRHEGFLRVTVPEGFRLRTELASEAGIKRKLIPARISSFPQDSAGRRALENQGTQQVWQILDPAFRSTFRIEEIEPGFLVSPRFDLHFSERAVELTAAFDVQVYRGSLRQLDLLWTDFDTQQWRVEVAGSPVGVELLPLNADAPADDDDRQVSKLRVLLTEPKSRTHGDWTIELKCRAPVPEATESFPLTLPQVNVAAERLKSPVVEITNASNVESTLTAANETAAQQLLDVGSDDANNHIPKNQRRRRWVIDTRTLEFDASVAVHAQTVACSPSATIRFDENRFEVQQRFDYSVAYEPLSRVRVDIPVNSAEAVVSGVEFWLLRSGNEARQKLTRFGTGLQLAETTQRSLQLPQPLWGRFSVACEYSVALPEPAQNPEDFVKSVPLVQSADAVAESTRVEIQTPATMEIQLPADVWQPELSASRFPAWVASGSPREVQVTASSARGRTAERFSVRQSFIQSQLFQGSSRTIAAYLIDGDVSWLTITFPDNCNLSSIEPTWDGEPLERTRIRQLNESARAFRFDLQTDGTTSMHVLQLTYQSDAGDRFRPFSQMAIVPPKFSPDVLFGNTHWDIRLPADHYVFAYPEAWTPRMRWLRDGLIWRRNPVGTLPSTNWPISSDDARSLAERLQGLETADAVPYRFSAFGHQQPMTILTMSRPAIVMAGTGLALAIGLILLRVPATRHILTLLVLTFAISVVGLWHLEALQLLAQPAVCGLLLAAIGTLIDSRARQKQKSAYVTYSSPSDFMVPPGSSVVELMQEETKTSPRRTADAAGA
ncbi:MAG: hypothetical protein ACYTGL_14060 [Planctomycetota bacterium]